MRLVEDILEHEIMFYDLETDDKYAPYAEIRLIGYMIGFEGEAKTTETSEGEEEFRRKLADPNVLKVTFNGINFDNVVLDKDKFEIADEGVEDVFLMIKTIAPRLPAFSQKFAAWWFFGDHHFPEMDKDEWCKRAQGDWATMPKRILRPYLKHDLVQLRDLFCMAWEHVQKPEHWKAYCLDRDQGPALREMVLRGGLLIDTVESRKQLDLLQIEKERWNRSAYILSDGAVENANSSKQLGAYLDAEGFELALSANGDFVVRKADLVDLRERNPVAECAFQVRKCNGTLKYFENYLTAAEHDGIDSTTVPQIWIPGSWSVSGARTRRFTSSSKYGINFQNPNEEAKAVQLVPEGWLGVWIDSTQVENVVHIYESEDDERREDYESNEEWNEYVWLCNRILGGNYSKKELDDIDRFRSPQIPNWTVYKQYKTAKLALNFGMGVRKFCALTGVNEKDGRKTFDNIHEACPAIHKLQDKVKRLLLKYGRTQDVFGHIYADHPDRAYKAVAYLVQGCGTGSLPKAQIRANYKTLHRHDRDAGESMGIMCGTTHDENSMRINLDLGPDLIVKMLRDLIHNMTARFSPKFDGIPLRAKLYLSRTNTKDHEEVDIRDNKKLLQYCKR